MSEPLNSTTASSTPPDNSTRGGYWTGWLEKCVEDESVARDQLQPLWIQSSAADKASCVRETSIDGTPSYVELLTCLEMARDVKKTPK